MTSFWLALSGCRLYHMTNTGGKIQFSFCVNFQVDVPQTLMLSLDDTLSKLK